MNSSRKPAETPTRLKALGSGLLLSSAWGGAVRVMVLGRNGKLLNAWSNPRNGRGSGALNNGTLAVAAPSEDGAGGGT